MASQYSMPVEDVKKALEKGDIEKIKDKKETLQEKAMALATKVYEEAAKNAIVKAIAISPHIIFTSLISSFLLQYFLQLLLLNIL